MTIEFEFDADQQQLRISGDLSIYHANDIKAALLDRPGISLDLGGVGEMDSAGLQLLLLAIRDAGVRVSTASDAVHEALRLTGLGHLLEAQS